MWPDIRSKINVVPDAGPDFSPSAEALDRFEALYCVKLPRSYRQFITHFGPGLLGRTFRFAAPECSFNSTWYDLDALNQSSIRACSGEFIREVQLGDIAVEDLDESVRLLQRMVFFASVESKGFIGWDHEHTTLGASNEYGIYLVPTLGPAQCCADSFPQFISEVCLGNAWRQFSNCDEDDARRVNRYTFACLRNEH